MTTTAPQRHKLLNPKQAAAWIGVTAETLRAWTIMGQGPRPYLWTEDGRPQAWTLTGLQAWAKRRKLEAWA